MQVWFDALGEIVELQKGNNARDVTEIGEIKSAVKTTMLLLIGLAIIIMIPAGLWVTRQITGPLDEAVAVADAVAAGNLDNTIDCSGQDEPAHLMSALSRMQADLKNRTEAERKVANEALRIEVALDVTSNSVMVADPDGIIIYCNAAVLEMMRVAENDIRKDLPNFKASTILGSNFDIYHKNTAHQRNMLAALKGIHSTQISVGGLNHEEVHVLGDLIRRIRDDRHMTILLVEHHMGLVMSIADHVVALNFGRKLAEGTPD